MLGLIFARQTLISSATKFMKNDNDRFISLDEGKRETIIQTVSKIKTFSIQFKISNDKDLDIETICLVSLLKKY